jgi:hypothetical protein
MLAPQEGICCTHSVSITFRDMPSVSVDYTTQAVWSFCNSQLTGIMDRTTRTASGGEEMLLHVAIRSADLISRLYLSVGLLLFKHFSLPSVSFINIFRLNIYH